MSRPRGARILVVEDERGILRYLHTNLAHRGFQVEAVGTGQQALESYTRFHPDLILLDLGLPDISGLEIIRQVRKHSSTPIIVLSAREAEHEKVTALDLGADDYLTKPFGIDELLARVRVALRHAARPAYGAMPVFQTGDLAVDLERRRVTVAGNEVHLSPTEYELLKAFIGHPDKVLTDRMLLDQVWGAGYAFDDHYLHVYVARLRKKLHGDSQDGRRYLVTEPGVGYRLVTDGG
ncbi:MAG: response regulator transcription factor [Chloroflexota bacterium]|nr:response regulator transcription factor [Chloroflexota bacterium]